MVYTCDSKSHAARLEGSSPSSSTLNENQKHKPKVVAIVGQTASGKSALAVELAKQYQGEVISCDSRQVYRGLDIGSGKITTAEMQGVSHHLLDIRAVAEVYTAADFRRDAEAAIAAITNRGHIPIIAGGTFFYLDQLRYEELPPIAPNESLRATLEALDTEALFARLSEQDPVRASTIDKHNRRRLIRALEIVAALGSVPAEQKATDQYDWLIIGINIDQAVLDEKIKKRLEERMASGMITEVQNLLKTVPAKRLKDLGLEYRYVTEYLEGGLSQTELEQTLQHKIRQFSRRQRTWLKRDKTIEWFSPNDLDAINSRVAEFLTTNLPVNR